MNDARLYDTGGPLSAHENLSVNLAGNSIYGVPVIDDLNPIYEEFDRLWSACKDVLQTAFEQIDVVHLNETLPKIAAFAAEDLGKRTASFVEDRRRHWARSI